MGIAFTHQSSKTYFPSHGAYYVHSRDGDDGGDDVHYDHELG